MSMNVEVRLAKAAMIYTSPFTVSLVLYYVYPPVGEGLLVGLLSVVLPVAGELVSLFRSMV